MNVLTVAEYRAIAACVLKAPKEQYDAAVIVLTKLYDVTDWTTDPKYDVHKEPPPCQS